MYDQNNIICKDVIEDNWLEYLKFIKTKREEQKKLDEARNKELLKNFVDNGGGLVGPPVGYLQNTEVGYYFPDLNSFWNWYIDNKVTA